MDSRRSLALAALALLAVATCAALLLSGLTTSQAVQNPTISLDMDPAGNSYSDPGAGGNNSMAVGAIDSSSNGCPGNNLTHTHAAQFIIRNVEDLIGWQARLNYDGGKMRPNTVNFGPFMDTATGQLISFVNLPIDSATSVHREAPGALNIPPAAPGPQTAAMGASYGGSQNFAISPDTPPKSLPDDTSYSAPSGGVLAALNLQVLAGNDGQTLGMDLDDGVPNAPGSGVSVFTGSGSMEILLSESALGDGSHLEGIGCPSPTPSATPGATPTPTPTTTATPPPLGALRVSLDMDPSGNSYSDPGAGGDNSMVVGTIDDCLTTAPGNDALHIHPAQVIVQNVRDLIGWQTRLNYDGAKMRPTSVNFTPFMDTATGQNVSFVNLPIESALGAHRELTSASNIPPAAPGPQTAIFGSLYNGSQDFPISPDSPPKSPPDDTSYRALFGGVLATVNLQVLAGNAGQQSLFMNLDDGTPNAPGSGVVVFDGFGTQTIDLLPNELGDGFHGEGASCVPQDCTTVECPPVTTPTPTITPTPVTPTPTIAPTPSPTCTPVGTGHCPPTPTPTPTLTPTPTPTCTPVGTGQCPTRTPTPTPTPTCFNACVTPSPTQTPTATPAPTFATPTPTPTPTSAGHDSRLARISGVSRNVRLSPGGIFADTTNIVVTNQSAHTDTIGVYVDVMAPAAGGCTPNGRVLETTVTLAAGAKTTTAVPVTYSCSDPAAANGLSFTWVAVADHGADDQASCGPGTLQSIGCFNALADDDQDPADNRATRNGPRVIAQ